MDVETEGEVKLLEESIKEFLCLPLESPEHAIAKNLVVSAILSMRFISLLLTKPQEEVKTEVRFYIGTFLQELEKELARLDTEEEAQLQ